MKTLKTYKLANENHLLKLFENSTWVAEAELSIESPDKFFDENYVSVCDLEVFEPFQGEGYGKQLLNKIFDYVKNELKLNIITLIVEKANYKAVNLYFNNGFKVFMEYKHSYSLVKKLNNNKYK